MPRTMYARLYASEHFLQLRCFGSWNFCIRFTNRPNGYRLPSKNLGTPGRRN